MQSRRKRKPDPAPDGPWNLYRKEKKTKERKKERNLNPTHTL